MFSPDRRDQIRSQLLERARVDPRITGAAVTGSGAHGTEDGWSDIDLFFGVTKGLGPKAVMEEWSAFVYQNLGALHHFDLEGSPAIYRAFLLPACLELDLGFTAAVAFGPLGPNFRTVFGEAVDRGNGEATDVGRLIGLAWHHVLHARICIERKKVWQAEHWISGVRDHTLALACFRLGKPVEHAKGVDFLPRVATVDLEDALVSSLSINELRRALRAATRGLRRELEQIDAEISGRLDDSLVELAGVVPPEPQP